MEAKVRKGKLIQNLILVAIGAIIGISALLTIISSIEITNTYNDMIEEELKIGAEHLQSEMNSVWDGDWSYVNGDVYKGEENIMGEYQDLMDELHEKTGIEYSLFYGDTQVLTTVTNNGTRLTGYKCSTDIADHVLKTKSEYYAIKSQIQGTDERYYIYYAPMLQSDGSIAGMVFAGRAVHDVEARITKIILTMVIIAAALVIILSIIGYIIASKISVKMRAIADELGSLSQGNLKLNIDETSVARNDEIGLLADGAKTLSDKLGTVIRTTMDMSNELKKSGSDLSDSASQASQASGQVSEAIDEISKGAVSQAESVENAAGNTQEMGNNIDVVTDNVNQLQDYAKQMKESCIAAMDALNRLIAQSNEVQASVREIGQTIDSTNESAREISKFSEAITSIASQTNLLSLNASIEAARAGDAGKGFAVVATEIGQLAVQSSDSADEIKKIVDKLVADSEASVEVMHKLNSNFEVQETQLDDTKTNMQSMADNVDNVAESTENISSRIEELNAAKDQLVNIISDLSAVSQENAASAEETNASMQELNATFTIITEAASNLQDLASNMTEAISYFKP
ncbi:MULTISPECIES: methyl-accepting chemotaxis protein [unclassified Butyrivibrio]|uniref:methyl-accepting chemotaxis protein n=1 Tax=unclassified Butyrivibrio TaxID=2639466 RepID=UPI0004256194|nr:MULTISPECIES: methyl-accepting chemotaxis protein [unclassified Butyrivibrio]